MPGIVYECNWRFKKRLFVANGGRHLKRHELGEIFKRPLAEASPTKFDRIEGLRKSGLLNGGAMDSIHY